MSRKELLSEIRSTTAKGDNSKELLDHILKTKGQDELLKFFISMLDYEDTLNDYLCDFCDINNCFPEEDEQIFSNSNKVEYQDHIIEDNILPLQAMYYSINKLK